MIDRISAMTAVMLSLSLGVIAQRSSTPAPPPSTPRAAAPIDLTGTWVSIVTEDWRWRMVTPPKGDTASVPVNAEGAKAAAAWDLAADNAAGNQCKAFGVGGLTRQPGRLRISWQDDATLKLEFDAGTQTRLLNFDRTKQLSGPRTWQGFSVARWDGPRFTGRAGGPPPPGQAGADRLEVPGGGGAGLRGGPPPREADAINRGGSLTVQTTNVLAGYVRKNGVPYSESASITEYFHRLPTHPNGDNWLHVITLVDDPKYFYEPFTTSTSFRLEPDDSRFKTHAVPHRTAVAGDGEAIEATMRILPLVLGVMAVCSIPLAAQWPTFQEAGVPRDAQGRVRMDAPAPKTPDGKPDLSGVWMRADRDPLPPELAGLFDGRGDQSGRGARPPVIAGERIMAPFAPDPNSPPLATFWDLGTNIPGGLPLTPWAAELKKQRVATDDKDNPDANCMPMGFTQFHMQPQPRKIVQTPKLIVVLYEANYGLRYIYTDGRKLPPQGDVLPWWYGYSVGRWENNTLVVETNNLRGAENGPYDGWLDVRGSPYSDQAKITERFRRPIFGKLEIDFTIEDPKAYTKPFTVRMNQRVLADEEPIEFVCNENQQFRVKVKVD